MAHRPNYAEMVAALSNDELVDLAVAVLSQARDELAKVLGGES